MTTETRRGQTGLWTYLMRTNEGSVFARSEWGKPYMFREREWQALPLDGLPDKAVPPPASPETATAAAKA